MMLSPRYLRDARLLGLTAMDACAAGSGDDVITFSVTGSMRLDDALPALEEALTITGPGLLALTLDVSDVNLSAAVLTLDSPTDDQRFEITGLTLTGSEGDSHSGLEVSWQVTGIRQDPYAEQNRVVVEEAKPPEERGFYLHPEAYGQPKERGIGYAESLAHRPDEERR